MWQEGQDIFFIALNFQSDFPNLIDWHTIFPKSQGLPAPGSERQANPCEMVWAKMVRGQIQKQWLVACGSFKNYCLFKKISSDFVGMRCNLKKMFMSPWTLIIQEL